MPLPPPATIPAELRALKRWVVWRLEDVGRPKKAKVPYVASLTERRRARTTDERDWHAFDEALEAVRTGAYDGVGFVFTQTPYVGIDLDGALQDGVLSATADEFFAALPGAYAERSQSGHGIHLIVRGALPAGGRRKDDVEMYDASSPRYFAITGDLIGDPFPDIPDYTPQLGALHARHIGGAAATAPAARTTQSDAEVDALVKQLVEGARAGREARRFFGLFDAGEFYEGKRSEADYDLAKIMWRQPGATEDAVVQAMAASALFRDKWAERRPCHLAHDHADALGCEGGRITILRHTVREAKPGGGAGLEAERNQAQSGVELLRDPEVLNPPVIVAPHLAWAGFTSLFAGREKTAGKSTLLTAAAAAVTTGRPFLGVPCGPPAPVLWLSADLEPKAVVVQRFTRFRADPARFHLLYPKRPDFEGRLEELELELERLQPRWLVVDTMAHFALVEEASQAAGWIETLGALRRVTQRFKCGVTLVHNTTKGTGEYRDSTAVGAIVDQIIYYEDPDPRAGTASRKVWGRGRIVGWQPFAVTLANPTSDAPEFEPAQQSTVLQLRDTILRGVRRRGRGPNAVSLTELRQQLRREIETRGLDLATGNEALDGYVDQIVQLHLASARDEALEEDRQRGQRAARTVMDANEEV